MNEIIKQLIQRLQTMQEDVHTEMEKLKCCGVPGGSDLQLHNQLDNLYEELDGLILDLRLGLKRRR